MSNELVPRRPDLPAELIRRARDKGNITDAEYKIIEPAVKNQEPSKYMPDTNDVILAGILIDDSGSVEEFGNTKAVIEGHNSVIDSLKNSDVSEKILFRTKLMKEQGALNNWVPLDKTKLLTKENYQPDNGTPLYDASIEILGSAIAVRRAAWEKNKISRFGVMILSDGEDWTSPVNKAENVKTVVEGIVRENDPKNPNTIAFMGLPNNNRIDYKRIATDMGIIDQRTNRREEQITQILTPESDPKKIRRAFEVFSKSVTPR